MPVVTIQQAVGKTKEQRQHLIERITEVFEEVYEVKSEAVMVFFQEYDDNHWGKRGELYENKKKRVAS